MTDTALALLLYVTACAAASLGKLNDTHINKREVLESYPNWVPFKNKHGDQLGEWEDVTPKAKVKKRLAPPANFLLRAVAEPQGDDYYEKGQGESDSEDYFEKKDWSDINRPEVAVEHVTPKLKDLSDIDGVIHIITQERPSLAQAKENSRPKKKDDEEKPEIKPETLTETPSIKKVPIKKKVNEHKYEDDIDYEDPQPAEKTKPEIEEEQAENEAKKKLILDSVDELKERHAQEQRAISDKIKEEEFDQEAFERDQVTVKKHQDKYEAYNSRKRGKVTPPNYDEYDEVGSWRDKYVIRSDKTTAEPKHKTEIVSGKLSVFRNPNVYIIDDENDIPETTTQEYKTKSTQAPRRFSSKYSTNTLTTTEQNLGADSPERIEIVPKDMKKGEAVLFFPKLKNKRKLRTTTVAPDTSVAETIEDSEKLTTKSLETTAADTTKDYTTTALAGDVYKTTALASDLFKTTALGNDDKTIAGDNGEFKTTVGDSGEVKAAAGVSGEFKTTAGDSGEFKTTTVDNEGVKFPSANDATATGPSGDAQSTNSDAVTDTVPASSDQKKEEPKDYHVEKGGGHEHHSEYEEEHAEHGKKAYEGLHKDAKSKKGHHDKEDHLGKYEDHAGSKKEHHDENNHYGSHHHEEQGKKHAKYEESGKHSKGHSTKGSHDIHKKEEYEKKVEFFEEEGDSAEEEKHGGYNQEREHSSGGKYKKGNQEAKHEERKKGESGHFGKGGHHFVHKGHKVSGGHDSHGKKGGARHAAEGHKEGKKWIYHHGFPAKTANLVIIDRRGDEYVQGPSYYG